MRLCAYNSHWREFLFCFLFCFVLTFLFELAKPHTPPLTTSRAETDHAKYAGTEPCSNGVPVCVAVWAEKLTNFPFITHPQELIFNFLEKKFGLFFSHIL
jgi:hypothetical protein